VTWNDYEEGTEIETGIDNCVNVSASVSGTVVNWSISGQMNTVDHFSVFISQDGQNLMWLAEESTDTSSVDLAIFGLPAGTYTVFVKAVGKPSLTNKMSSGAQVTLSGPAAPPATGISLNAPNGASATISAGQTANYGLQLTAAGGPATVTVACVASVPAGACAVASTSLTVVPGTPVSIAITVSTSAHAGAILGPSATKLPPAPSVPWLLPVAAMLSMVSMLGWFAARRTPTGLRVPAAVLSFSAQSSSLAKVADFTNRRRDLLAPTGLLLGLALVTGCGGGSLSSKSSSTPNNPVSGTPAGAYTLVVTATSGSLTQSQSLTLNVQ
jgi:hypothetical protein